MYKLISKQFKKTDVELFISYHRWELSNEHKEMLIELSNKGELIGSDKNELTYLRNKLEYGGFEGQLIFNWHI